MVANLLLFFNEEHLIEGGWWASAAATASLGGQDVPRDGYGGPKQSAETKDRDGEEHPHACFKNIKPAAEETALITASGSMAAACLLPKASITNVVHTAREWPARLDVNLKANCT